MPFPVAMPDKIPSALRSRCWFATRSRCMVYTGRVEETIMWYNSVGLVVTLVLLTLWAPLAAHAPPSAKVPRIGFLRPSLASPCRTDAFAQGLRELGYVEGYTIVIEWRCADGTPARARELAVELVQLPVDVFVAAAA